MAVLNMPKDRIRPEAKVEELLPSKGRREIWAHLQDNIGLRLPPLELPIRAIKWCLILSIATWPFAFLIAYAAYGLFQAIILAVFPGFYPILFFVATLFLLMGLTPLHTEPPNGCDTIAGLTRAIVKETYGAQALKKDQWNDQDVWEDLVLLIEEWGFSRDKISEDTHFVADLGAYTL
jgi:hypothetical protein